MTKRNSYWSPGGGLCQAVEAAGFTTGRTVRAAYQPRKGESVVYTSGHGLEFLALVLRAHRDGSATIRVQWAIRDGALLNGFWGDVHRVEPHQLSPRTAAGVPVGRLRHPATPAREGAPAT